MPELFLTNYFCQSEKHSNFNLAEKIPGTTSEAFSQLAKKLKIILILSLFEKRTSGIYHNTCIIIDENGKIKYLGYNGTSGASFSTEVDFTRYMPYEFKELGITYYAFADAGVITDEKLSRNNLKDAFYDARVDAGFGFAYTFSNWGSLEMVKPLTIRLDMPLFLNRPPNTDDDFLQFRWVLGINRSF